MLSTILLTAANKPDAVSQIAHAYIWQFIITAIIVPIIGLIIYIVRIVRQNISSESDIPVNVISQNQYDEENLIRSAYDKLCKDELGIESLTEEEKAVLRKHGINV